MSKDLMYEYDMAGFYSDMNDGRNAISRIVKGEDEPNFGRILENYYDTRDDYEYVA